MKLFEMNCTTSSGEAWVSIFAVTFEEAVKKFRKGFPYHLNYVAIRA